MVSAKLAPSELPTVTEMFGELNRPLGVPWRIPRNLRHPVYDERVRARRGGSAALESAAQPTL
jgi:hypothetical protein